MVAILSVPASDIAGALTSPNSDVAAGWEEVGVALSEGIRDNVVIIFRARSGTALGTAALMTGILKFVKSGKWKLVVDLEQCYHIRIECINDLAIFVQGAHRRTGYVLTSATLWFGLR